jgi:hypothetical protein
MEFEVFRVGALGCLRLRTRFPIGVVTRDPFPLDSAELCRQPDLAAWTKVMNLDRYDPA